MQTEVVQLSSVKREIKVRYSAEEVAKTFKKQTKKVSAAVSIKGFRPGKAPEGVIAGKYGAEIRSEVMQELLEDGLKGAMVEHRVVPVGPVEPPDAETARKLEAGQPFDFSLKFEVRPEFPLAQYKGLKLTKAKPVVTDVEVDKEIERVRMRGGQLVPVLLRDFIEEKDFAVLDVEARTLAGPLEAFSAKDELVEMVEGRFLPGFVDKMLGMKIGSERAFDIVYPADGPAEDLRDKTVMFRVVLKQLKKLELPTVDDELAKDAGYESLVAMKEAVNKSLGVVQNMRARNKMREQIHDQLIAANTFEVPESLIRDQSVAILREALRRLQQQGQEMPLGREDVDQLLETYRPRSERIVRSGLIMADIAKAENVQVSDEDLEKQIQTFAEVSNQDPTRVRAMYADQERRDSLRFQMIDEKVLDFLVEHADVSDGEDLPEAERQL